MLDRMRLYLGMIRFSHTVFALPFALASAVMAWQREPFRWADLAGVLACMVFARSAAMGFNRLIDRRIDADNPRTANRHLPAGLLSPASVAAFTSASAALFVASTGVFLLRPEPNWWPAALSGPVLMLLLGYSLAKRFTALSHFWLGLALALAPVAAWVAIAGVEGLGVPVLLGAAVLSWVAGFDILYACQDQEFDRSAGLHSIPARLGVRRALAVAFGCHVVMVAVLVALGWASDLLGPVYFCGVGVLGAVLMVQHWLVRPDDLRRVNQAFFQVNAAVSVGLLVLVGVEVLLRRG